MTRTPKVLLSYAWIDKRHDAKVEKLAAWLRRYGIDAELHRWDLRAGQDVNAFMERMVSDPAVTKVLVICNARYRDKANARLGGVGTETTLIADHIYRNPRQTKFVPVVFEYEGADACVPVFLRGKKYVDFSTADRLKGNWSELLEAVRDQLPADKLPLGTPGGRVARSKGQPRPRRAPASDAPATTAPPSLTLRVPRAAARKQLTALQTELQPLLSRRAPRNLKADTAEVSELRRRLQRWNRRVTAALNACFTEGAERILGRTQMRYTTLPEVQGQLRKRAAALRRVDGLRLPSTSQHRKPKPKRAS